MCAAALRLAVLNSFAVLLAQGIMMCQDIQLLLDSGVELVLVRLPANSIDASKPTLTLSLSPNGLLYDDLGHDMTVAECRSFVERHMGITVYAQDVHPREVTCFIRQLLVGLRPAQRRTVYIVVG